MGYRQKVVIIGAGISGLACAYRLKQLGIPCLVLEAAGRAGGVMATARQDGYLFELGPQCPRFPAAVWQLVRELHLENEFVAGDRQMKRYIFRHGALQPAPFSPGRLLTTGLVGLSSKIRMVTEVLRTTRPPAHEETVAEFVTRKFGAEVVDNLVDPLLATIFFGDAHKMGMESSFPALVDWEKTQGSLVRGALRARNLKRQEQTSEAQPGSWHTARMSMSMKVTDSLPSLGSFRSGMARLPERLAQELRDEIRYGVRVETVTPGNREYGHSGSGWQIVLPGGENIYTEQIVLSLPAYEAGRVLQASVPSLAHVLSAIEYTAMSCVSSGYERRQVRNPLDGFGCMVPRCEGLKTICTFWNSSLFPGRAPDGKVLMTSFVRSDAIEEAGVINEDQLARAIEAESAAMVGVTGEPSVRRVWAYPRALPQYNVGHRTRVTTIHGFLRALPNLHLAGNYLRGRSVGECVELALHIADHVYSQLGEAGIAPVTQTSEE